MRGNKKLTQLHWWPMDPEAWAAHIGDCSPVEEGYLLRLYRLIWPAPGRKRAALCSIEDRPDALVNLLGEGVRAVEGWLRERLEPDPEHPGRLRAWWLLPIYVEQSARYNNRRKPGGEGGRIKEANRRLANDQMDAFTEAQRVAKEEAAGFHEQRRRGRGRGGNGGGSNVPSSGGIWSSNATETRLKDAVEAVAGSIATPDSSSPEDTSDAAGSIATTRTKTLCNYTQRASTAEPEGTGSSRPTTGPAIPERARRAGADLQHEPDSVAAARWYQAVAGSDNGVAAAVSARAAALAAEALRETPGLDPALVTRFQHAPAIRAEWLARHRPPVPAAPSPEPEEGSPPPGA